MEHDIRYGCGTGRMEINDNMVAEKKMGNTDIPLKGTTVSEEAQLGLCLPKGVSSLPLTRKVVLSHQWRGKPNHHPF